MRLQDKIAINNMRLEGHSPTVIAAKLGIPAGTVRSHIHRHPNIPGAKVCKNCGKVYYNTHAKSEFCGARCRNYYNVKVFREREKGAFLSNIKSEQTLE